MYVASGGSLIRAFGGCAESNCETLLLALRQCFRVIFSVLRGAALRVYSYLLWWRTSETHVTRSLNVLLGQAEWLGLTGRRTTHCSRPPISFSVILQASRRRLNSGVRAPESGVLRR